MSKSFKWFAVLAVALPLWFIAWRMYDEWRVRAAYRRFLVEKRLVWSNGKLGEYDSLVAEERRLWEAIAEDARALGLRHPQEWQN